MYESPIIVNVTDPVFESMNKAQDEYVIRACQRIRVDINQEELVKALQYDRSQYEKGYADGLAYKPPAETNADRIRAMPDGELAKYLCGMGCPTGLSPNSSKCPIPLDYSDEEACYKCWFKWLIQEVWESE